jgi:hypothetical protein
VYRRPLAARHNQRIKRGHGMNQAASLIPGEISQKIFEVRGQRVMLDSDLAALYGATTKRLNEQVRRNLGRFPPDFAFQLTADEWGILRSQNATSKPASGSGGRRYIPYVFTEHGAIQAANVLSSPQAAEMGVYVVRAFVYLRSLALSHKDLAARLDELEQRIGQKLRSHDQAIAGLIDTIRELMQPPAPKKRPIGFITPPADAP